MIIKDTATPAKTKRSALVELVNRETINTINVAKRAPRKANKGTVNKPINKPVCNKAKIAPKAPPEEMPNKCGSASRLRVTDCKLAPTIASPEPTIIANKVRGNRMSQTIASLPFDQVCSTRSGENLFNIIPQTVLVWTETAPTDIPIDNDIINNIDPKQKNENTFLFEFLISRFTTFEIKLISF